MSLINELQLKIKLTTKKILLGVLLLLSNAQAKGQPCNPAVIAGTISVMNDVCYGSDLQASFSSNFTIQGNAVNWNFTGSSSGIAVTAYTLKLFDLSAGGTITASGSYWNGSRWCPFNISVNINVHSPGVTATSPVYFIPGNNVTLNSTTSGVGNPPNITWSPNIYFAPPSVNTDEDPLVNPPTSMVYVATVSDPWGCGATATVEAIAKPYATLTKTPEGGYYTVFNNMMMFKYDGQYASSSLTYNIVNKDNQVVASNAVNNLSNSLVVSSGDNRYHLYVASLNSGNYILEVINEKKEKLYLRFSK